MKSFKTKDVCFSHDPRVGGSCPLGVLCTKEHLDTFEEECATRFDDAISAWSAALARRRGKAPTVDAASEGLQEDVLEPRAITKALFASSDYVLPKGVFDVPWYYDKRWYARAVAAQLLCTATCLANTPLWPCTPRLRRHRELEPDDRAHFAELLGKRMGSILCEHGEPAVLCIEKPYLPGFVAGLAQTISTPFVLLAVNGGDAPLTLDVQEQIAELPFLRACFANNLHRPRRSDLFFPMPLGLPHHADGLHRGKLRGASVAESAIRRIRKTAPPWEERDSRLLIAPMSSNRIRSRYIEVLAHEDYRHLVRIVDRRLDFDSFLSLLAEHRYTLSPPGKGFDCYRTWQAIAVGTSPLVVPDELFDMRLYTDSGLLTIPPADKLTPGVLDDILSLATDPACSQGRLEVSFWTRLWDSYLQ